MRPRILFVIDTLETGGAERSLCENLLRLKHVEPVVCHLYHGDTLRQALTAGGIRVYAGGIRKKYGFLQAYRKLSAVIKEEDPSLIVAYLTRSEMVSRIAGGIRGIPVIGTFISDLYSQGYNQSLSAKARLGVRFFKLANRITARICKGFIANSESVKQSSAAQLKVPLHKIEVIPRGRDSKIFTFKRGAISPGEGIRFLNVGRLTAIKAQKLLISAFAIVLKTYPDAILHIAGEGPERKSLESSIEELGLQGKAVLLGTNNNIAALMHHYDCFVFPSLSEGFSNALLEAMFCGLPALASDIPANREMIEHGKTGRLFESSSVESIVKAMSWFGQNRSEALDNAASAHEYALSNFEQAGISDRMETYLLEIMETAK